MDKKRTLLHVLLDWAKTAEPDLMELDKDVLHANEASQWGLPDLKNQASSVAAHLAIVRFLQSKETLLIGCTCGRYWGDRHGWPRSCQSSENSIGDIRVFRLKWTLGANGDSEGSKCIRHSSCHR